MPAVATDLCNVLIGRVPAVVATILLVPGYRARAGVMSAFVVVRHIFLPRPLQILPYAMKPSGIDPEPRIACVAMGKL